jgi:hypothetical protein
MQLSPRENFLYDKAIRIGGEHRVADKNVVSVLMEVESSKLYRKVGRSSLFEFATLNMGLSENVGGHIVVARKALQVPALADAIQTELISVPKACRFVSVLTKENAAFWIDFAKTHTFDQINREVAKGNPKVAHRDTVKHLSDGLVQIKVVVTVETLECMKRSEDLLARKTGQSPSRGDAVRAAFSCFLRHEDPVVKAEDAVRRKEKREAKRAHEAMSQKTEARTQHAKSSQPCVHKIHRSKRVKLTAEEKHAVHARDQGRCTHIDQNGVRCSNRRWIEIHHIQQVCDGGGNDLSNLSTLCSFHHDLVHQLNLPLEGQFNWLRSPRVSYRAG